MLELKRVYKFNIISVVIVCLLIFGLAELTGLRMD